MVYIKCTADGKRKGTYYTFLLQIIFDNFLRKQLIWFSYNTAHFRVERSPRLSHSICQRKIIHRVYWIRLIFFTDFVKNSKNAQERRLINHFWDPDLFLGILRIILMGVVDVDECKLFGWIWKGTTHLVLMHYIFVKVGGGEGVSSHELKISLLLP